MWSDYVNIGGIILEIIGFAFLLTEFRIKVEKISTTEKQKGYFIPRNRTEFIKNHFRSIAIILVIIGLTGQGISVGLANMNM